MCKYCDNNSDDFLSKRTLSDYHEQEYTGIGCYVDEVGKSLMIEACLSNGYEEPAYDEICIGINYCPMCGRKLR